MRVLLSMVAALAVLVSASAEEIRFIGKSVMFSDYVIIRSLLDSRDHKSFVRAARTVGLDRTLLLPGSTTVFAPDDAAFAALAPEWKMKIIDRPRRQATAKLLACHIVTDPRYAGRRLSELMRVGDRLVLPTLGGCPLTVTRTDQHYVIEDDGGRKSIISQVDILQANGMMQLIDRVMLPSS
jgi:uncharacterized surface protein with fasciclin (FAS1) repeats